MEKRNVIIRLPVEVNEHIKERFSDEEFSLWVENKVRERMERKIDHGY